MSDAYARLFNFTKAIFIQDVTSLLENYNTFGLIASYLFSMWLPKMITLKTQIWWWWCSLALKLKPLKAPYCSPDNIQAPPVWLPRPSTILFLFTSLALSPSRSSLSLCASATPGCLWFKPVHWAMVLLSLLDPLPKMFLFLLDLHNLLQVLRNP